MASGKSSLVRRALVQIDLAFWCLHEQPLRLAGLALPTLLASAVLAMLITSVARTWELPGLWNYALYAVVYPWIAAMMVRFAPLPGAVFAWHRAKGEVLSTGQCFHWCARRGIRLARVGWWLGVCDLFGFALLGLPLLVYWPRTCLAPMVALFEDETRIFRRSRRLLREEFAVCVLAALYFCLFTVLGGLLALPRVLLQTNAFGMKLFEISWTRVALDYLWILESLGGGILLSGMALCWSISLTLLYREIRRVREGDELKEKLEALRRQLLGTNETFSLEAAQK